MLRGRPLFRALFHRCSIPVLGALGAAAAAAQPPPPSTPPTSQPPPTLVQLLEEPGTWRQILQSLIFKAVDYLPQIVAAVVVLLAFVVVERLAVRALSGVLRRSKADPALQGIGVRLLRYVLVSLGLLMAASQLGINVASVLAALGIFGLAFGLAAQDLLSNLIAGFTILWDRPFRIGDEVTIGDTFGRVAEIGLRSTRLHTPEARDAILPNKQIINQMIVNHTLTPELRLDIPVGVAYGSDLRRVREALLEVAAAHEAVRAEPPPQVVITALGDSAVQVELRAWLRDPHQQRTTRFELLEEAKLALDRAGIEIPFPQRVVHLLESRPRNEPA
jgi:small conductance mechanosensitive channel